MKDILKWVVLGGLFIVPLLTLYVENNFFFPYITGKNFAFRIIVEVVFMSWAVLAFYDAQYRPRWSWLLGTFGVLLAVMLAASLNAFNVETAIWSNYERMDGYVTLVHLFLYFVVLGTMLQTPKLWSYFLHTTVLVAGLVAIKGLSQLSTAGGVRVDSTLGNAAYMAVYMLFHIFILLYLLVRSKVTIHRVAYVLFALLFFYVLLQTGTRGTAIGLVVGIFVTIAYIAIFSTRYKQLRKYAAGSLVGLILIVSGFIAVRDSSYIQNNGALSRIANISLGKDLAIRTIIWGMAGEGVKERPILGWGQGNFNYVFNSNYDPRMYAQEQWFDRVHNIFFDWLIAGGILGLLTYFSIFGALLYYLIWRPLFNKDESFTVLERGVLLGLVAGYLTHNLVVFDNIVSYIFFGTILALIHSRVATPISSIIKFKVPTAIVTQVVLPVAIVLSLVIVYVVNIPGILAANDILLALQAQNKTEQLAIFERALGRGSFARQEIVEQFTQAAMSAAAPSSGVPAELQTEFKTKAEKEILDLIKAKPGDARLYVFLGSFYRSIGELDKAKVALATARTLSPKKQAILLQQGAIELGLGNYEAGRDFFKEAFLLDERYDDARLYYVATLFMTKDIDTATKVIAEAPAGFKDKMATSDFLASAVNTAGDLPFLADLYETRLQKDSSVAQNWASLAFVYYQMKENDKAVDALARAKVAIPSFATMAQCISNNIVAGNSPQEGCQ